MVEPKTYDCPYTGGKVSGIGARNCNNSNLEDYSCRYGGTCVAKEGMIEFEQGLAKCKLPPIIRGRKGYFAVDGSGQVHSLDADLPGNL